MNLYATTTSDRKDAKSGHNISKGLGGNEYLEIEITDEIKRKLVKLDIWIDKHNHIVLKYQDCMGNELYHDITLEKAEQKGKQQTNEDIEIEASKVFFEKRKCDYCNKEKSIVSDMLSNGYHICDTCSLEKFKEPYNELETMREVHKREKSKGKQKKGECNHIGWCAKCQTRH